MEVEVEEGVESLAKAKEEEEGVGVSPVAMVPLTLAMVLPAQTTELPVPGLSLQVPTMEHLVVDTELLKHQQSRATMPSPHIMGEERAKEGEREEASSLRASTFSSRTSICRIQLTSKPE